MRRIRWSRKAQNERLSIFKFWIKHNQSETYSKKLRKEFRETTIEIANHPEIGKHSGKGNIRMKMVRDYWIFYSWSETEIRILQIKSTHQDPTSFYKEL